MAMEDNLVIRLGKFRINPTASEMI